MEAAGWEGAVAVIGRILAMRDVETIVGAEEERE